MPRPGSRVTVEVLNASGRTGLARAATRQLRSDGIDVVSFATADTLLDLTTILVRREGKEDEAARVREILGTGLVQVAIDTLRRLDLSVLLGHDYDPPPLLSP